MRRAWRSPRRAVDVIAGGGLARALLLYMVAVIGLITLTPFEFALPVELHVTVTEWTVLDLVANVLLFVPIGFLAALGGEAPARRTIVQALVVGALLSLVIETAQLFLPSRYSTPWDVLTNSAGAACGAAIMLWLRERLDPSLLVGRLALELPLVGLVYLMVPLGWLHAITAGADLVRLWPVVVLGLAAGSLLGAVQQRYLGPAGVASPRAMSAAAAGWFVVAMVPAIAQAPLMVVAGALLLALFTWHRASARPAATGDRRFERDALMRAAPFFVSYLLLLPLAAGGVAGRLERAHVVLVVEGVAVFTVLGYMTAEAMGRRERSYREGWPVMAGLAALAAAADWVLRQAGWGVSAEALPKFAASIGAALYGGWLYHLQRDQVTRLVHGARPTAG